jgi:tRNA(Ile)-lysidine synthase
MPAITTLGDGYQLRPMLTITRQQILDYANQYKLQWIEDESNQDIRFDRNFLRHKVMPVLQQRWPAANRTLARTATHTAGLVKIADELLLDELADVLGTQANTLSISKLKVLSFDKAALLTRALCYQLALPVPATAHLLELFNKQLHAETDRQIHINWPGAEIRRFQDDLYLLPNLPVHDEDNSWSYKWSGEGELSIPECRGHLNLEVSTAQGISQQCLQRGLQIKPRTGGERCQPAGEAHNRDLKAIYQQLGIPPWERQRLPLIYSGDKLIAIADRVICKTARAAENETGYKIIWKPFIE